MKDSSLLSSARIAPSSRSPEPAVIPASAPRLLVPLDGAWDLAFDPDDEGKKAGWPLSFPEDALTVSLPSVWEKIQPGYDGVGWYRRQFILPQEWTEKTLRLRFHAAQYFAEVWLNGTLLGSHEGGYLPFEFSISDHALPGKNEIVVRVINPPLDREIEGFRCGSPLNQGPIPTGKAGWYYNFGGLWQSIELQINEGPTLTRVAALPALDRLKLQIEADPEGRPGEYELSCTFGSWDGSAQAFPTAENRPWHIDQGSSFCEWDFPFPNARLWSPEDPFLYTATVTLREKKSGKICDQHVIRFGMRECSVRNGRFHLNEKPVVLKGFLHQGSYPRTLVRPEDEDFARRELEQIRNSGFNFIRAHLQPPLPSWLDLCDELGLLVMAEPPIGWLEYTPQAEERGWREIAGLVNRDTNHPSIIFWCLMNEVFHLRGFTPERVCEMVRIWSARVAQIDPTRPIIDVSGGHGLLDAGGAADMLPDTASQGLTAGLFLPGEARPKKALDSHIYHEFPVRDATWQGMRHVGGGTDFFFTSEFGAPPVPPLFSDVLARYTREEQELGLEDYRLHFDFSESLRAHLSHPSLRTLFKEEATWIDATNRLRAEEMRLVTTALRSNPHSAGYCFCQWADASGELFGAVDAWRRPKPLLAALGEGSSPRTLGVFASRRTVAAGQKIEVELVWLDDRSVNLSGPWKLELRDASGKATETRQDRLGLSGPGPQTFWKGLLAMPRNPGSYILHVEAETEAETGSTPLRGHLEVRVVPKAMAPRQSPPLFISGEGALRSWLTREGYPTASFGNNFREVESPVLLDLSGPPLHRVLQKEMLGQLRKALHVGGCAILFEPEMQLVGDDLLGRPIRMQPLMRPVPHVLPHPVFDRLPSGVLADFTYANVLPDKFDRVDEIDALGGSVLFGALSMHMWTRPAVFYHGAALYTVPVGQGLLIVCNLKIVPNLENDPVAALLLENLIGFAREAIRPGDTRALLSRCIDPLPQA